MCVYICVRARVCVCMCACVCLCVHLHREGLPSEVDGLHSFTGIGDSKHLPKNTRYVLLSELEVSRLFPLTMTLNQSFNN